MKKLSASQKTDISREARLWAGVGLKLLGIGVTAYIYIPQFKNWVDRKIENAKIKTVKYKEV